MICCNKCGSVIPEPQEDLEINEDVSAEKRGRYKKTVTKEDVPARRPSLVSMPVSRAVNGYEFTDVDLCGDCIAHLFKKINELKFAFMTGENSSET